MKFGVISIDEACKGGGKNEVGSVFWEETEFFLAGNGGGAGDEVEEEETSSFETDTSRAGRGGSTGALEISRFGNSGGVGLLGVTCSVAMD
ncbi:hypothetical protein WICPIJ_007351 [Wickerhamomyces pijperi]|uniref:Uncharacterized protein n=1 Tax=Wickerhamomyces pijperi TaxID=599730 RepID=A0A9P8Q0P5_WICPI|nr:hypothetical protein WICPIJ_007351 [Wickerhamomyces pijperi]